MRLHWRLRIAVLLSVLLAQVAYGMSEHDPALTLAVIIASIAGWWFSEFKPGRGFPRWLTNLVLVGVIVGAVWRVSMGGVLVSAFTGFLATLLVIKLWERRKPLDYGQLLTMSLFLLVGATLTDNSLTVGLSVVAFLPVFVTAVMLYQLYGPVFRAIPNANPATNDPRTVDASVRRLFIPLERARGGWLLLYGLATFAVIASASIAIVVFILVPRGIGLGRMGEFGRANSGRTTGFTDRVELGQGGLISQSQMRVLEMRVENRNPRAAVSDGFVRYLRGAVLERYEAGAWTKIGIESRIPDRRRVELTQTEHFLQVPDYQYATRQEITILGVPTGETPLFSLYKPYGVSFQDLQFNDVSFDQVTAVLSRRGPAGQLRYSVDSYNDPTDELVDLGVLEEPAFARKEALDIFLAQRQTTGFPSRKIQELATSILRDRKIEPDPSKRLPEEDIAAARALRVHLEQRASYTLDILAAPQGTDPIEWFLFDARSGHCEYFASALAALCRSVGINARVVTGYVAGEYDQQGDVYIVRASNAHAWVEARVGPSRWITLDATPPSDLQRISSPSASLSGRFWRWLDGAENIWSSQIVSYDTRSQEQLLGRGMRSPAVDRGVEWFRNLLNGSSGPSGASRITVDLSRLALGLVLFIVGGVIVWLAIRKRGARIRPLHNAYPIGAYEVAVRDALLRSLAKRGHPKPTYAPLLTHARTIEDPALSRDAIMLAQRLYDAVFGGRPIQSAESRSLISKAKRLTRATRG